MGYCIRGSFLINCCCHRYESANYRHRVPPRRGHHWHSFVCTILSDSHRGVTYMPRHVTWNTRVCTPRPHKDSGRLSDSSLIYKGDRWRKTSSWSSWVCLKVRGNHLTGQEHEHCSQKNSVKSNWTTTAGKHREMGVGPTQVSKHPASSLLTE